MCGIYKAGAMQEAEMLHNGKGTMGRRANAPGTGTPVDSKKAFRSSDVKRSLPMSSKLTKRRKMEDTGNNNDCYGSGSRNGNGEWIRDFYATRCKRGAGQRSLSSR
eukprot:IDg5865t1